MKKSIIPEIVSVLFIFLFVYTAFSKIIEFSKFNIQLAQSPLLVSFTAVTAFAIPAIELITSAMLLTNKFRRFGLYSAYTIMVMFTAYIVAITRFSEYIPCSCGGVLTGFNWNQHLVFNIAFVFLAAIGIIIQSSIKQISELHPTANSI